MPFGFNSLRDNPFTNAILGQQAPANQPGVGNADPTAAMHFDPGTGMYYDPTTGQTFNKTTFNDPTTGQPTTKFDHVTNPNIAQQVAQNYQRSSQFLGQLPQLNQERDKVFGQQMDLAKALQTQAQGGGPSVAGQQAQQGFNSIASQQLAQAAGMGGATGPLAQMLAARNTGSASIGANNAAAMGRAQEQLNAQNALGSLLGSAQSGVLTSAGQNIGAGVNFADLANTGQSNQQNMNQKGAQFNANSNEKFGYSLLGAAGDSMGLPTGGGGGG